MIMMKSLTCSVCVVPSGQGVDIGLVGWEAPDAGRFTARTVSGATEAQIDMEVKLLVDAAYKVTLSKFHHLSFII